MTIDEKELALAAEHPRGTERRRLLPYRAALNDAATYASLPESDRDAIVRWTEVRRRIRERSGSTTIQTISRPAALPTHDCARTSRGRAPRRGSRSLFDDPGGDLLVVVGRARAPLRTAG